MALFLLALGGNTPIFHFLYSLVPGFDRFRGPARFLFEAGLFGALLAAAGLDSALKNAKNALPLVIVMAAISVFLLGFGITLKGGSGAYGDPPLWTSVLNDEAGRHAAEAVYVDPASYKDTRFFNETREFAGAQCVLAGLVCAAIAALSFHSAEAPLRRAWTGPACDHRTVSVRLFRNAVRETGGHALPC